MESPELLQANHLKIGLFNLATSIHKGAKNACLAPISLGSLQILPLIQFQIFMWTFGDVRQDFAFMLQNKVVECVFTGQKKSNKIQSRSI